MEEKPSKIGNIEEKILTSLLEGPKTNTQLLAELGYGNKQHGNISRILNKCQKEGLIVSEKIRSPNIDNYCTQWSIVQSFENLKNMLSKCLSLLQAMQKNDSVLEIIAENARFYVSYTISSPGNVRLVEGVQSLNERNKKDFKEMLRLSPEFFKYYLLCYNNVISKNGFKELAETLQMIDEIYDLPNRWMGRGYHYSMAFKACVLMDLLYGKSSQEAQNYLIEMEKKKC
ncbi:hypothetical protein DU38_05245 [Methanosarcina mazei]|uniref:Uncharacterized protein n=1 Tax=Methanosarcina mazei TaxID=2209 RepID=A0A0F8EFF1_METMZ|nr:hypothetical protein [Methanosarcina mazei]KKG31045.1 hypothetical protein DU49_04275 [Methanosarcina mazei]KKG38794.1 hypothetical protein DU35_11400 [Methanosarcina mazei]KKG39387.1 hypothetical protein DU41_16140 [Methanosarcina mazei]KKG46992.1 hypothetical protein DU39_05100 [Methanosarcina mazei]KKG47797.1 hypothetical protein DU38_05245 [Methanosarcina mazei]